MKRKITLIFDNDHLIQITMSERGKKTKFLQINAPTAVSQITSSLKQAVIALEKSAKPIEQMASIGVTPEAVAKTPVEEIMSQTNSTPETPIPMPINQALPHAVCARPKINPPKVTSDE